MYFSTLNDLLFLFIESKAVSGVLLRVSTSCLHILCGIYAIYRGLLQPLWHVHDANMASSMRGDMDVCSAAAALLPSPLSTDTFNKPICGYIFVVARRVFQSNIEMCFTLRWTLIIPSKKKATSSVDGIFFFNFFFCWLTLWTEKHIFNKINTTSFLPSCSAWLAGDFNNLHILYFSQLFFSFTIEVEYTATKSAECRQWTS